MQIKNYKAALASLDKIRNKDTGWKKLIRELHFSEDWNCLRIMEIEASIDMFDKSLKYEKYNMSAQGKSNLLER